MASEAENLAMALLTGQVRDMSALAPPIDYSQLAEDEWLAAGAPDYIEEALIQPDDVIPFEAAKTAGKGLLALALMGSIKPVGKAAAAYAVPEAVKLAQKRIVEPLGSLGQDAVDVALSKNALDMSHAARMQRAAEQGYLPGTFYHGTNRRFEEFMIPEEKFTTDAGIGGTGIYFTAEPDLASLYAERASQYTHWDPELGDFTRGAASVLPVKLRIQNPINVSDIYTESFDNELRALGFKNWQRPQFKNNENLQEWGRRFTAEMKSKGFDGIIVDNGHQVMALDPSQIRSVFAAFDPKNSGSASLLSGITPAIMIQGEDRADQPPPE